MTKQFSIMSEAEMSIMDIIWACNQPKTINELTTDLLAHHSKQLKPSTVNTLCARLMKKGFVTYIQISGRNYYLPLVRRVEYQFAVAKLLVDRLFNSSTVSLVSTLLMDSNLSRETLDELKTIVESASIPFNEYTKECKQEPEEPEELEEPETKQPKQQVFNQTIRNVHTECALKKCQNKIHMPRAA